MQIKLILYKLVVENMYNYGIIKRIKPLFKTCIIKKRFKWPHITNGLMAAKYISNEDKVIFM